MAWDFATEPEFEAKLEWMRGFVRDEIIPLETLDIDQPTFDRITAPLKEQVKEQGLWAAHLPPEMGGGGFGQVKLGLMHEILGPCRFAPSDLRQQRARLRQRRADRHRRHGGAEGAVDAPAARGELRSCFSMTEPGAGADPTLLPRRAVLDGDEWVINGHKWFSSNASVADFLIVMCVTDPDVSPYQGSSMIIVPTDTPGVDIVRDIPTMDHPMSGLRLDGGHAEVIYRDVRVPYENLVGNPGDGFRLAQKRLGPGRIHHAMRWLGQSGRAFDMLCERAVSRYTHGSVLAEKQMVQDWSPRAPPRCRPPACSPCTRRGRWTRSARPTRASRSR